MDLVGMSPTFMSPRPLKLAVLIGTRPEAIKLAPVILRAREQPDDFSVRVIRTGQHRELVDQLMAEFAIRADVDLKVMQRNQSLADLMAQCVRGLTELLSADRPDWTLVQGDTTTTFAGALAAFYNHVRLGHVEAGLRTNNRHSPFPEEANRAMTACVADLHFAPTEQARRNLLRQGIAADDIFVTGNTGVDALTHALGHAPGTAAAAQGGAPYVLVTAHRRENHGAPLQHICDGIAALLERHPEVTAWIPMHPSPVVRRVWVSRLGAHERVRLTEPLGYIDFIRALHGAALVLTDSGGVQEECATLGKPVLVLRADTERPEAVDAGVAALVGTDAGQIVEVASRLLAEPECYRAMAHATQVFGEGSASVQILDALKASRYNAVALA
ncbi:MAG: non-hydrolyzing UDP-N-acetylglucosamine 2-epimerase [Rhizobacter sp.]